jgi:acetoacetyl-CoA reductase
MATWLITGCSTGLGRALAEAVLERGDNAVVTARDASKVQDLADAHPDTALALPLDVTDNDQVTAAVAAAEERFGAVDVLVNNAGITRDTTIRKMTCQQWQEVIDTNLGGCFNMAKAVFDGMIGRKYGRIVNIGSINGQAGQYGQVNYAAAKSGIHGFTKALAQEGARFGVTVNAIAPGYIDTDMVAAVPEDVLQKIIAKIPVGRLGKAGEIARAVAFLVDEHGGFITGSTLSINGGQHMY